MRAAVVVALTLACGSASAERVLATNTAYVEALATDGEALWVATRGGVEAYDLATLERTALYTTEHGLAEAWARDVAFEGGAVVVDTTHARCRREGERFRCVARADLAPRPARAAPIAHARRTTATLEVGARRFTGTAGDGVWIEGEGARRLTPRDQICSNHVVGIAEHRGAVYLASFDEGLCRLVDGRYQTLATPFRMVNRILATPHTLFVAANEGLFLSRDGVGFTRVMPAPDGGWNGLALAGDALLATTPVALYRFHVTARAVRLERVWERPGGSTALQGVAVGGGATWLASEDRGVLRVRGREITACDRAAGMPSSWVVDVAAVGGVVYAATLRDGLARLEHRGGRVEISRVAGTPPWLLHLAVAGGTVWVGAQGGAAYVAPASDAASSLRVGPLPHANVYAIARIGGALFIATEGGLLRV